jgi:hypothetical protein
VAGQAFHWFEAHPTRAEFRRILRPTGWVMLVWNERDTQATPFLRAYEQLLGQFATDYAQVNHKQIDHAALMAFFGAEGFASKHFRQRQEFDLAGVRGRLLSSSYAPEAGHPRHEPMLVELARIFEAHQVNGRVGFEYLTNVYYGRLS